MSDDADDITELVDEASGARCRIHAWGATVLSYTTGRPSPCPGREVLFVSRDAVLDGTKAIRGGIPIVFPIFGPPPREAGSANPSTMPQHGFARTNRWARVFPPTTATSTTPSATFRLDLADVANGRGENNPWERKKTAPGGGPSPGIGARLELTVSIGAESLTSHLRVTNTGSSSSSSPSGEEFSFQALFHTYYRVSNRAALDPAAVFVAGLEGYDALDQLTSERSVVGPGPITIGSEVDAVHSPPPGARPSAAVTIGVGDRIASDDDNNNENSSSVVVDMTCQAHKHVVGTAAPADGIVPLPVSVVVWNPHARKAAAMADFGDDEYLDMVCVEPGILGRPTLSPGESATIEQVIAVRPCRERT
jgi:glucose-6-phosphate 1-epimerase